MQEKIKRLDEKNWYCFCTGTARMPVQASATWKKLEN
jgi:hypothetical protein